MNPLDDIELNHFIGIIKNDMPLHTNNNAKLKHSFSQKFPKNLMEYSGKVNNKFLNDNLAIIEEINHRDSKHWIPRWFQAYQNKIYGKTDILNHDNFLKDIDEYYFEYDGVKYAKVKGGSYFNQNILSFSHASLNRISIGATLTAGDTSNNTTNGTTNMFGAKITGGVVASLYDQIASNIHTGAGNYILIAYDDTSGEPTTKLAETSSVACSTGFNLQTVTEFSMVTTAVWIYQQHDNGSARSYYRDDSPADTLGGYQAYTYGVVPDPFGTRTVFTQTRNVKVAHS